MVEPVPISLDATIGPSTFTAWEVQGEVDGSHIQDIYAPLESATKDNNEELLHKVASSYGGADFGFILCIEDKGGITCR